MDPTAQKDDIIDLNSQASGSQKPNFIEPGQFVVAGADANKNQPPNVPVPAPVANVVPEPPVPNLQQDVAQTLQEETSQSQKEETPAVPILKLAQEEVPPQPPQPANPQTEPAHTPNVQPDPTPFTAPNAMGASAETPHELIHGANHSSILKNVFIGVGALVLIAILGGVAYFFVFEKGKLPISAKSGSAAVSQVDEPPSIPKRITGGFANLPLAPAPGATNSATPSSSLLPPQ